MSSSDELEALLLVLRYSRLEEHGVCAVLRVEEGHVAVDLGEEVHALVPLLEVGVVLRETHGASRAAERPP